MRILGIHDGHGSSAALLEDGVLRKVVEEERFTRIKADSGFPKQAVDYLVDHYPGELKKLDYVAIASSNHDFSLFATKRYPRFDVKEFLTEEERYWIPTLLEGKELNYVEVMKDYVDFNLSHYPLKSIKDPNDANAIRRLRRDYVGEYLGMPKDKVIFVDHHTCHAHHAYFSSTLRGGVLVFTMDGSGDGTNATVHMVGEDGRLKCLYRTKCCNLGRIYQYITLLLGMKPAEHEYKVMGLAAYAKERHIEEPLKVFKQTYFVDGLEFRARIPIKNHYQYFKQRLEGYRFDAIAGALQRYLEDLLAEWIGNWLRHMGLRNVVFSGGVGLNIKANKRVSEIPEVDDMFVCMAGGDESISIGAAQCLYAKQADPQGLRPILTPYLGPGFDHSDLRTALTHPMIKKQYETIGEVDFDDVAAILAEGKVVSILMGDMEFGPRALGNRSLLADPRNPQVIKVINATIKNRDFWMPFTPSILAERAADYLVNPKGLLSPFMTMAFDSTELGRRDLAAAIHAGDMTVRPQIVTAEAAPLYWALIKAFERRTGVGGVLNTSLNIHGKPIVRTPMDLVNEVLSNQTVTLDYILLEKTLLRRV
ncbi:hypothetical protein MYX04_01160 [Nitrospiraceae bacterium AH_259_D15_M11_P09]|nr:hypothetical protein [Nitrospiraceae bacterium AH_259_D15_M11_P09]